MKIGDKSWLQHSDPETERQRTELHYVLALKENVWAISAAENFKGIVFWGAYWLISSPRMKLSIQFAMF
jgi:hypothetical protein